MSFIKSKKRNKHIMLVGALQRTNKMYALIENDGKRQCICVL